MLPRDWGAEVLLEAPSTIIHYPSPMDNQEVYSAEETAKILGISNRRVRQLAQEGRLEGERSEEGWKLFRSSVHSFRDEKRAQTANLDDFSLNQAGREALEEVKELRFQLGRFEGRLELEAVARSTLEEALRREKERADEERMERIEVQKRIEALRLELEEARLSWWKKLFR